MPELMHEIVLNDEVNSGIYDLADNIYAHLDGGDLQLCIYDISNDPVPPPKTYSLDFMPYDMVLAPSQDLVVLMRFQAEVFDAQNLHQDMPDIELYLRSLSSGGLLCHPNAQHPVIAVPLPTQAQDMDLRDFDMQLQIIGDTLALFLQGLLLRIYRWTNSKSLIVSLFPFFSADLF